MARSVVRYRARLPDEDEELVSRMRERARGRPGSATGGSRPYGVPAAGGRTHRPWRREGLKIPRKVRKGRRPGHDGSGGTRRRAVRANGVWSHDLVFDRAAAGRRPKILPIVGGYARECRVMLAGRRLTARDVIRAPGRAARGHGMPELIAAAARRWPAGAGAGAPYVEPGSPWGNAHSESFDSRLRDEVLNGELFSRVAEAAVLLEQHRRAHNGERPHSAPGYVAPAVFARQCVQAVQAKASSA